MLSSPRIQIATLSEALYAVPSHCSLIVRLNEKYFLGTLFRTAGWHASTTHPRPPSPYLSVLGRGKHSYLFAMLLLAAREKIQFAWKLQIDWPKGTSKLVCKSGMKFLQSSNSDVFLARFIARHVVIWLLWIVRGISSLAWKLIARYGYRYRNRLRWT